MTVQPDTRPYAEESTSVWPLFLLFAAGMTVFGLLLFGLLAAV